MARKKNEVLDFYERKKKERKEDKALDKELKKEDKELEKECGENPDFLEIKNVVEAVKMLREEDEEVKSFLTESDRQELNERDKEENKLITLSGVLYLVGAVAIALLSAFIYDLSLTDLEKNTLPIMEKYFLAKYDEELTVESIEYFKYLDEERKELESNIIVAKIEDTKNHVVSIDNDLIGDDIDNKEVHQEYINTLIKVSPEIDIINNNPILSYKDYYKTYNVHIDHIKALPNELDFEALQKSKKLTVHDLIVYKGNIDIPALEAFVKTLSEDSLLVLVDNKTGIPNNITIITSTKTRTINITFAKNFGSDAINYELDPNMNAIKGLEITEIAASSIQNNENTLKTINPYFINFEEERNYDDKENNQVYFLISIPKAKIDLTNITLFDSGYDSGYQTMTKDEYPMFIYTEVGNRVYILGTQPMGIGTQTKNEEALLCILGFCD